MFKQKPKIRYQPKPLAGQDVLRFVLLLVAVTFTFMLHVWMRTLVIAEGFKLGEVRGNLYKLESERVKLRLDREKLISPNKLTEIVENFRAEGRPFVSPNPAQILFYEQESDKMDSQVSRVPAR